MIDDWDFTPDITRRERLGFDEAVFCAGKSLDQIDRIVAGAVETQTALLLTRLEPEKFAGLAGGIAACLDYDQVSHTAFVGPSPACDAQPQVAIVTAGSSDIQVAREAVRTLNYYGMAVHEIYDVGVAGLWRLLERVDELKAMPVVITVAGMEGALASVVGGLVSGVVIAVPVATGYGVAANGITALHSALSSCVPGLVVVNVDNGYGAGCAALRILNIMRRE